MWERVRISKRWAEKPARREIHHPYQHPPWQSSPGELRVPHTQQENVLCCGQGLVLPKINASPWERASIFLPLNQERVQPSHDQGQVQSPLGKTKSFQSCISSFSILFLDNSSRWKLLGQQTWKLGQSFSCLFPLFHSPTVTLGTDLGSATIFRSSFLDI